MQIAPHDAHYEVRLLSARNGSGIERVTGDMAVRWEQDCSGWTMIHRTVFEVGYSTGSDVRVTIDASTWESGDGTSYSFLLRTRYDDREAGRVEGHAHADGSRDTAVFTLPEQKTLSLPRDVLFPTQHTRKIIDAAKDAPATLAAQMFDGFTENGAQLVNAVIGRAIPADGPEKVGFPVLSGRTSWPVQLAFFTQNDEAEPESEIGMRLYDNGVADGLDMDFGEFRVHAVLRHLEVSAPPACRG
ncbi:MAG: DUF1849 family protein [Rhodospirillaceae bacterium]